MIRRRQRVRPTVLEQLEQLHIQASDEVDQNDRNLVNLRIERTQLDATIDIAEETLVKSRNLKRAISTAYEGGL